LSRVIVQAVIVLETKLDAWMKTIEAGLMKIIFSVIRNWIPENI